jgi:hypothetical protein
MEISQSAKAASGLEGDGMSRVERQEGGCDRHYYQVLFRVRPESSGAQPAP